MSNSMHLNNFVRLSSLQSASFPSKIIPLQSDAGLRSNSLNKRNAPVQNVMMKSYGSVEKIKNQDVVTPMQRSALESEANAYVEMRIHMFLQMENEKYRMISMQMKKNARKSSQLQVEEMYSNGSTSLFICVQERTKAMLIRVVCCRHEQEYLRGQIYIFSVRNSVEWCKTHAQVDSMNA